MTETACTKEMHTIELTCNEVIELKKIYFWVFNNYKFDNGKTFLEIELNRKKFDENSKEELLLNLFDSLEEVLEHGKKQCFGFKNKIHFLNFSCLNIYF